MNDLAARIPEAGDVIRAARRQGRGEVNPYIEMMELIHWIESVQAQSRSSAQGASRAAAIVQEFLAHLESKFEIGDQDVDNLVAVGFLEGLRLTGDEFPALRAQLPPRMSAWFALAVGDDE